ncbi:hypothetical protein SASPL_110397 [Salvia splendens]|uniref:1-phosphatidylinositol 4-kinase n=1 Tax=Salvia splendens TaxID=180675 RepID=A0A8X9A463_SALSN|nr:hypothetical protein SASPL_110397 [Salvia splendens]
MDSPVQTQMAVAAFKSPLGSGEYHGTNGLERKSSRRVFVQTETGCVLGMELNRSDNVNTVKRRLQVALNFPIEESSLTFGDMVLKNDLSAIRNDSPLLLTRNLMHRSSSTPCLSPTGKDIQQRDQVGRSRYWVIHFALLRRNNSSRKLSRRLRMGLIQSLLKGGLGGAYYFRNVRGDSVAIVKPTDEEPFAPNNPKGFVVAAYLLDYDNFANVPPTSLVKITHSIFNINDGVNANRPQTKKLCKQNCILQQYIPHDFDASDHGTSSFPVSSVHRIGILDIRIFNTDRHAEFGNPYFEWIHWPQASIPFSDDELEYISNLDPARDSEMLRSELPMIREACLRVLHLEFRNGEEEPSDLEVICIEARRLITEEVFSPRGESDDDGFLFDIDCEDGGYELTQKSSSEVSASAFHFGNGHALLSRLEEGPEEEEESEGDEEKELVSEKKQPKFPKFAASKSDNAASSSSRRSANEQLPASSSFVKLADMKDDKWALFLEKVQELLHPAFAKRKSITLGQKQRQRLGTSCQF